MSDEHALDSLNLDEQAEAQIRRVWHEDRWFFSVIDVVGMLTDTTTPKRYWTDMKRTIQDQGFREVYEKIVPLKMLSADGKQRLTDAGDAQTMLRIVQSIPSPKAEPLKQWLARVGVERLEELEDPSSPPTACANSCASRGYSEEWINQRLRAIVIRDELTTEWAERGVRNGRQIAQLTNTVHQGSLGPSIQDHKVLKHLEERENLRPHLTTLEMAFLSLGEATTAELHRIHDSHGFTKLHEDAQEGGTFAGDA